ncbi:M23 family metallopeptidase [Pseudoalteromonas sp. 2102]|uniref:M23 family metallopeptidase n=1 Tax=Pseudoalteromonas sp. 2102 TaxID=2743616 RepID=UPI0015E8BCA3|nr:M23 family metallopeptidase [Pseudoalteromonas sp. 2102]
MLKNAFLLALFATLVACGGGGGDNTSTAEPTNPPPTNTLPSVNAGEDQTVVEGSEVSLEGEATDSDGSIVSYSWIQLAGESVSLTDSDKIRASFDAPDVEERVELSFQLTVTDNDEAQSSDTISIFVEPTNLPPTNTLPSVNAGEDQTVVEGSEVSLEGEATDSDGSIVSYSWIQLAGESVSLTDSDKIRASFDAPEVTYEHELILELTVTDNNGLDNSDTIAVFVIPTPADIPTKLMWPIECEPGIDCTVGYADVDGDGVAFNCENPSYQGHEGIDINLNDGLNTTKWEQMDKGVNVLAAQSGVVLWAFDDETAFDKCTENTDIAECNAPTEQNGPNVSSGYRVCTDLGSYCAGGAGLCYWCFDGKNVVVIKHEGEVFATRYDHLKSGSVLVEKGDTVFRGQKIAEVGSAGRSTGPHLHFEVWKTDYYSLGEPFAGKCGPNFENSLWNLNKFPWFVK